MTTDNRELVIEIYNCIQGGYIDALIEALDKYVDNRVEQKLNKIATEVSSAYGSKKNPYVTPDLEGSEDAV
ncbi:MAG TPA: hypothetical protein VF974_00910 [Patescibacteria group bacterium]